MTVTAAAPVQRLSKHPSAVDCGLEVVACSICSRDE
jgi:hypothetical protein